MGRSQRVLHELGGLGLLVYQAITSRFPIGENVFHREWDILIILDACRVDALRTVKDEYEFITDVGTMWSIGGTSKEWLDNTFVQSVGDEVSETAYVTANPFFDQLSGGSVDRMAYAYFNDTYARESRLSEYLIRNTTLPWSEFGYVDPVYQVAQNGSDDSTTPLPSQVTNHAIWAGRNVDYERLIIHYMQPHAPYFRGEREYTELADWEQEPLNALRNGMDKEPIWNAYLENLRFVLDSVSMLLENIDGDTVAISADHGELFGESSLVGHGVGIPHPKLRYVPWVETSATDRYTIGDIHIKRRQEPSADISAQLEQLGYL